MADQPRLHNVGGRQAAQALLASDPVPDVIVCGFDGLPHSRSELVGLTTIVQPQIEMAHAAYDVLQQRLDHPSAPVQTHILPHRLWIGRNCGCPPEEQSSSTARPQEDG